MTVYNKLKIAILTIMSSQTISAITIDPIQVQSGPGDLLYAEMKFHNADPNAKIEAGLANADEIMSVGIANQPPGHLNFYTRRSGDGTGVIVITSSRPIIDSELNILLKVKEGNATHIQQIKTPLTRNKSNASAPVLNTTANEKRLTPQIIVSEKDIALNLPTSMHYQVNTSSTTTTAPKTIINKPTIESDQQRPLTISVVAPPTLKTEVNTTGTVAIEKVPMTAEQVQVKVKQIEPEQAQVKTEQTQLKAPEPQKEKPQTTESKTQTAKSNAVAKKPVQSEKRANNQSTDKGQKHIVQANESLWRIASRIAADTNQSIPIVMQQIKENNASVFIQGDVNRIRRGAALNLATTYKPKPIAKYQTPNTQISTKKQSGSEKYRLDQAEMSLITDNEQSSAQGSAKKNTQVNQTTTELSTKVMTSREKTVKLQKSVNQLATALQQKNQRIQLLNARLAQLQQQLQQQNVKKPNS